ncbi:RidA family protein [Acidisphaera sp. L21]|uniref:RidA family protein n=1 Tax=Acidisphaera sp. L21 TaxID=1641851 RepID=UPI00131C5830|nr:RidA family protein [Acidisphaera sp. L21]
MIQRFERQRLLHRAVKHNGVLYLAGMTAEDRSVAMKGQTEQILDKAATLLAEHDSDKTKILAATIFITDMAQKEALNEAWIAWFDASDLPTRAVLGVAELGPGALVEIVLTAAC